MTHPYLDVWLQGSTCHRPKRLEVMFENDKFIVLKHRAHSDYVDRSSKSQNCEAFAHLYAKADFERHAKTMPHHMAYFSMQKLALKEWTGRIYPRRVQEECAAMGVKF